MVACDGALAGIGRGKAVVRRWLQRRQWRRGGTAAVSKLRRNLSFSVLRSDSSCHCFFLLCLLLDDSVQ
ncbi:hypothetical protein A2U01_0023170, partial [Trifolium medium]|nr:hypothetical protein [Trifolium medium]